MFERLYLSTRTEDSDHFHLEINENYESLLSIHYISATKNRVNLQRLLMTLGMLGAILKRRVIISVMSNQDT